MRPILVATLLLLHACASVPPPPPAEPIASAIMRSFSLQGRVSVQFDEQSMSGQLNWRAGLDGDEVLLSSPLGQGIAGISRNASGVVLTRPGEPVLAAENVEVLTQKALGFQLPLSGLRYWIQAKPDPASASEIRVNPEGGVEQITQNGWKINYLQYKGKLPRKIHVAREGLEIRLVIDEWLNN